MTETKKHNLLVTSCPCESWCSLDGVEFPDAEVYIEMTKTGTFATIRVPVELVADIKPDMVEVKHRDPVDALALEQEILENPGTGRAWIVKAVLEKLGIEAK
ncbi:hypothetical protein [Mobiluncus curtisii]|uniref:Uncharacterized protein n=1 Tax=Mobiluncus curtisii ATCC 51333 TaxID=887326 RepID=E6M106_9ACTO|nr:hypothetical protein [Mobiluncus curtisii]EFU79636.1 hypothetical protein HMPREF0388_1739 [Mobiluncus curtisii ATCC 51333]